MWLVEEGFLLDRGILAGSPIGFLESSRKTFHTVSHSRSISAMSFCRFGWKEEVVKVIETLTDQRGGRSVGRNKGMNHLWTCNPQWG